MPYIRFSLEDFTIKEDYQGGSHLRHDRLAFLAFDVTERHLSGFVFVDPQFRIVYILYLVKWN